ncbi:MAG TPA: DUF3419 family protein, partial [Bacteroidia bacterium]|nr:DUF3419 family protein [Bacteroidia bacterium]
ADHDSFLSFLGFSESNERKVQYDSLRALLSPQAAAWWDAHFPLIARGVITQGKFENYFRYFRTRMLPLIHSKKDVAGLFREKEKGGQEIFYRTTWNTWRWRMFFRIFFSRYVMGKYGRDPEFMREVNVSVSDYIFSKAENELRSDAAQENLFLKNIMTGNFGARLPFYARKENFENIRNAMDRFHVFRGYAEDACRTFGKFSAFNLSNIFEYLSPQVTREVAEGLVRNTVPGARFAYWNLMVPRKLSQACPGTLEYREEISDRLTERDMGFFYLHFNLDVKK